MRELARFSPLPALLVAALLDPRAACAQSVPVAGDSPKSDAAAASPSAVSNATELERARLLYEQAERLYETGDTDQARRAMTEAYELSKRAELLFNIGQLDRELGDCRAALLHYRQYMELSSEGRRSADARDAIRELEPECGEAAPAPAPAPPAPPVRRAESAGAAQSEPRSSYWTPNHVVAWSAISAGFASGAVALYFALAAKRDEQAIETLVRQTTSAPPDERPTWDSSGPQHEIDGQRSAVLARVFAGVGVGALATGLVVLALGSHKESAAPQVSLSVDAKGCRAGYALAF